MKNDNKAKCVLSLCQLIQEAKILFYSRCYTITHIVLCVGFLGFENIENTIQGSSTVMGWRIYSPIQSLQKLFPFAETSYKPLNYKGHCEKSFGFPPKMAAKDITFVKCGLVYYLILLQEYRLARYIRDVYTSLVSSAHN